MLCNWYSRILASVLIPKSAVPWFLSPGLCCHVHSCYFVSHPWWILVTRLRHLLLEAEAAVLLHLVRSSFLWIHMLSLLLLFRTRYMYLALCVSL